MSKKRPCEICQKETDTFCGICDVGICCADHWSEHCKKEGAKNKHYRAYETTRKGRSMAR